MIAIYVADNLVNGKLYVGQSKNFKKRHRNHVDAKTTMAFHNAIRKHGRMTSEEKQARSKKMHLAKAEKAAAKLLATNEPIPKCERRPLASD